MRAGIDEAARPGKSGSIDNQQRHNFTITIGRLRADFIRILVWLAVLGGAL
jgi:hypothetical protein